MSSVKSFKIPRDTTKVLTVKKLYSQGQTLKQIGNSYSVNTSTIHRWITGANLPLKRK